MFNIKEVQSILWNLMLLGIFYSSSAYTQSDLTAQKLEKSLVEELPPLPKAVADHQSISIADKFYIHHIKLQGSTLFSREQLDNIIKPYENRTITIADIHKLAKQLSRHYIDHGFVNSGVIIPDQKIENNTLILQVIEGQLTDIQLTGNKRIHSFYIKKRLGEGQNQVFNVKDLQKNLQRLQRNPRIKRIQANVKPSNQKGRAILDMQIEEAKNYHASLSINNYISPNVGGTQGVLNFKHINLTGFGDVIDLNYRKAEGLDDGMLFYSVPFTHRDTTLSLSYQESESNVVAKSFKQLDISGDSKRYSFSLRHPLYNTLNSEFALALTAVKRDNESFLFGEPFSFSAGVKNGKSSATIIRFSQEWVHRSTRHVFSLYSSFDFGIEDQDIDNTAASTQQNSTSAEVPTGQYSAWQGQLQWLRRLNALDSLLVLRSRLHFSADPLFAPEQFALGGSSSVRGYRENLITRDNGFLTSLEWRVPLIQAINAREHRLELSTFVDYGEAWNTDSRRSSNQDISSVGISLRWNPSPNYRLRVDIAEALEKDLGNFNGEDIQDDGLHFEVNVKF